MRLRPLATLAVCLVLLLAFWRPLAALRDRLNLGLPRCTPVEALFLIALAFLAAIVLVGRRSPSRKEPPR